MVGYSIAVEDEIRPRLQQFGSDAGKVLNRVLRRLGGRYRTFLRRRFMSGYMLGKVTGETYKDTKVRKVRRRHAYLVAPPLANIFESPGGVDIRASEGSVLRWFSESGEPQFARHVHLPQIPFVTVSYYAFRWDRETPRAVDHVVRKELAKRGIGDG